MTRNRAFWWPIPSDEAKRCLYKGGFNFKRDKVMSHDIEPHLDNLPSTGVMRRFIQNGLCLACNISMRDHRVVFPDELSNEWVVCWTETGTSHDDDNYEKHFCVRSEDHPNRITRDEFEDLYT